MAKTIKIRTEKILPKIKHLMELSRLAETNPRYYQLAMIAAENLGGDPKNIDDAMRTFRDNAFAVEQYEQVDGEETVVDEINFVRDIEFFDFKKGKI